MYIYTLDSHEAYGPFHSETEAWDFAREHGLTSWQRLSRVPYPLTTLVHKVS